MRLKTLIASTLFALAVVASPRPANAGLFVSVNLAPPPLPVYEQPPIPGDGYIWTPGYWGYGPGGYYWIPGAWVMAPEPGFLWTPGYWGWGNGAYLFHEGYWGPHVGFYGGINYGFGYTGIGYAGGVWAGGAFRYNRAVNNLGSVHVRNVYNTTVVENRGNRTSFNGGSGGVQARANAAELNAARDRHVAAAGIQNQRMQAASHDRAQLASVNHGRPASAAPQARALENQPAKPSPLGRQPNGQQQQRAPQQQARAQRQQIEREQPQQREQREQPQQRAQPFAGKPTPQEFHQERPTPQARPEPAARPAGGQHEGGHERR